MSDQRRLMLKIFQHFLFSSEFRVERYARELVSGLWLIFLVFFSFFLFSSAAAVSFHGLAGASGVGTFLLLNSLTLIDSWVFAAFGRVAPSSFAFRCCNREIFRVLSEKSSKFCQWACERVSINLANAHKFYTSNLSWKLNCCDSQNHIRAEKKVKLKKFGIFFLIREN